MSVFCIEGNEGEARFLEVEMKKKKQPSSYKIQHLCYNKFEVMLVILSFPCHNPIVHAHVIINVQ